MRKTREQYWLEGYDYRKNNPDGFTLYDAIQLSPYKGGWYRTNWIDGWQSRYREERKEAERERALAIYGG